MKPQQPLQLQDCQTVLSPYEKSQDEIIKAILDALTRARASFFGLCRFVQESALFKKTETASSYRSVMKGALIMRKLFTSESVTEGHPDKIAD